MSEQTPEPTRMFFSWQRMCIVCRDWFEEPDDDGWTTLDVGVNHYWRCPHCSSEDRQLEDA